MGRQLYHEVADVVGWGLCVFAGAVLFTSLAPTLGWRIVFAIAGGVAGRLLARLLGW